LPGSGARGLALLFDLRFPRLEACLTLCPCFGKSFARYDGGGVACDVPDQPATLALVNQGFMHEGRQLHAREFVESSRTAPQLSEAQQERYRERTMVERVNARIKDEFGGRNIRVRGAAKVMSHLMFGILALTQIRSSEWL